MKAQCFARYLFLKIDPVKSFPPFEWIGSLDMLLCLLCLWFDCKDLLPHGWGNKIPQPAPKPERRLLVLLRWKRTGRPFDNRTPRLRIGAARIALRQRSEPLRCSFLGIDFQFSVDESTVFLNGWCTLKRWHLSMSWQDVLTPSIHPVLH